MWERERVSSLTLIVKEKTRYGYNFKTSWEKKKKKEKGELCLSGGT